MSLFGRFLFAPLSKLKAPGQGFWNSLKRISNRSHPGYLRGWISGRKYRKAFRSEFKSPHLLSFFHYWDCETQTDVYMPVCVQCSKILSLLILLFLIPFFFGPLINQCSEYEVVLPGSTLSMQTEPSIKLPLAPSGGIRLYVSIQYPVSFIPDPL